MTCNYVKDLEIFSKYFQVLEIFWKYFQVLSQFLADKYIHAWLTKCYIPTPSLGTPRKNS